MKKAIHQTQQTGNGTRNPAKEAGDLVIDSRSPSGKPAKDAGNAIKSLRSPSANLIKSAAGSSTKCSHSTTPSSISRITSAVKKAAESYSSHVKTTPLSTSSKKQSSQSKSKDNVSPRSQTTPKKGPSFKTKDNNNTGRSNASTPRSTPRSNPSTPRSQPSSPTSSPKSVRAHPKLERVTYPSGSEETLKQQLASTLQQKAKDHKELLQSKSSTRIVRKPGVHVTSGSKNSSPRPCSPTLSTGSFPRKTTITKALVTTSSTPPRPASPTLARVCRSAASTSNISPKTTSSPLTRVVRDDSLPPTSPRRKENRNGETKSNKILNSESNQRIDREVPPTPPKKHNDYHSPSKSSFVTPKKSSIPPSQIPPYDGHSASIYGTPSRKPVTVYSDQSGVSIYGTPSRRPAKKTPSGFEPLGTFYRRSHSTSCMTQAAGRESPAKSVGLEDGWIEDKVRGGGNYVCVESLLQRKKFSLE